jgi:hypothetical protein
LTQAAVEAVKYYTEKYPRDASCNDEGSRARSRR